MDTMDLSEIAGADRERVQWLMCSGVCDKTEAKKMAQEFVADLERLERNLEKLPRSG